MTDQKDDAAEKPLDPAAERLRRKMVRLLAVAVSTLFIGVMAVLAAIVYKLNRDAPPAADALIEATLALPPDSRIVDMAVDGESALLRVDAADGGAVTLLRVDLSSGRIVGRYRLDGARATPPPVGSAPAGASGPKPAEPMLDRRP